jgi:hypothetical protein
MLLAMIVSVMGGVWIFLQPYVKDFQDNTNWASANGIADRLEDRFAVVGVAPEGVGIRQTLSVISTQVIPVMNSESWTISADLVGYEKTEIVEINGSAFTLQTANGSAALVVIIGSDGSENHTVDDLGETIIIEHDLNVYTFVMITVYDDSGEVIHRYVSITISGVKVVTIMQRGHHEIALINDARVEKFPGGSWVISQGPDLQLDELYDGRMRGSLRLVDVTVNGSLSKGNQIAFDLISLGPLELFSGPALNLRFTYLSSLDSIITPQIQEGWLTDYTLHRASGTLDQHRGISPWQRASGADGFTIDGGELIDLEIDLHRIEVRT